MKKVLVNIGVVILLMGVMIFFLPFAILINILLVIDSYVFQLRRKTKSGIKEMLKTK